MALAMKCDICGKYYECRDCFPGYSKRVDFYLDDNTSIHYDVCDSCYNKTNDYILSLVAEASELSKEESK